MKHIIAIDGYSSTGKSSYAQMLAKDLKWVHIDTGAMYRAITLYAIQNFYIHNSVDESSLINHLLDIKLDFKFNVETGINEIYLNNKNVESEIRILRVSEYVSLIAKIPEVRNFLVAQQRKLGERENIVMDGRDIGTIVFPNADLKFFITASIEERARRRFFDLQKNNPSISIEEVKENLMKRDYIDQHREISPLVKAKDAILIDNSQLTKQETYLKIVTIVREKLEL